MTQQPKTRPRALRRRRAALALALLVAGGLGTADRASAATYIVAPNGHDDGPGDAGAPFRTIAHAARIAEPGDRVVVRRGTYNETVIVAHEGRRDRPILFEAETPGSVVMSGPQVGFRPEHWAGDDDGEVASGNAWVTIRGFTFRDTDAAMTIRASSGWHVEDCRFKNVAFGINIRGNEVVVARTVFEDINGPNAHALVGVGGRGIVIRDVAIRRINTERQIKEITNSAVTKFLYTEGLTVDRLVSEDNVGPGLWLDTDNRDFLITRSVFRNNRGDHQGWEGGGLWIEINPNARGAILDNVFTGNTGAGLALWESSGIEVSDNLFDANAECIEFRNMKRDDTGLRRLGHIQVRDNVCKGWTTAAVVTSIGEWQNWDASANAIVIENNRYAAAAQPILFNWLGVQLASLQEVQDRLGFEKSAAR